MRLSEPVHVHCVAVVIFLEFHTQCYANVKDLNFVLINKHIKQSQSYEMNVKVDGNNAVIWAFHYSKFI